MIAWWWLLVPVAACAFAILVMLWFFGRGAQRYVSEAVTEHDRLREELRAANAVVTEQLDTIFTQNELIAGHTQFASRQYLSKALLRHSADSTWMTAEAQKAIRDRIGKHVAGLVHIEQEPDDYDRDQMVFLGTLRLRDILDSLSVVEGIVEASNRKEDR